MSALEGLKRIATVAIEGDNEQAVVWFTRLAAIAVVADALATTAQTAPFEERKAMMDEAGARAVASLRDQMFESLTPDRAGQSLLVGLLFSIELGEQFDAVVAEHGYGRSMPTDDSSTLRNESMPVDVPPGPRPAVAKERTDG